ncbi:MAG: hypothetical protein DHS20C15_30940 [Planctomycetota bacterium]|nr:MAG: hypothetical protein DHS20C15_30940 [Planctomycetota bacterium]
MSPEAPTTTAAGTGARLAATASAESCAREGTLNTSRASNPVSNNDRADRELEDMRALTISGIGASPHESAGRNGRGGAGGRVGDGAIGEPRRFL